MRLKEEYCKWEGEGEGKKKYPLPMAANLLNQELIPITHEHKENTVEPRYNKVSRYRKKCLL